MLGKKNIVATLFAVALVIGAANLGWSQSGTVGIDFFKEIKAKEGTLGRYTPNELYRSYKENEIRYEQAVNNKVFKIYGTVSRIRRGFTDEYIVELDCSESLFDWCVVYPKNISQAKINDLVNLYKGQRFEAIVCGAKIGITTYTC